MMPDPNQEIRTGYEVLMDYVSNALHASHERMDAMEKEIAANTEATEKNTKAVEAHRAETREMIDAFNAMKGGMKVLETVGKVGKIIGGIALAFSAVVGAYHTITKFFR